jgi:hypothetical protein
LLLFSFIFFFHQQVSETDYLRLAGLSLLITICSFSASLHLHSTAWLGYCIFCLLPITYDLSPILF